MKTIRINDLLIFVIAFMVQLLAAFSSMAQTKEVKDVLYMYETDRATKAFSQLESLIQANPTDASLFYYQGYLHLKSGDKEKAAVSFEKGAQLNPKEMLNFVGKGHINMLEKKFSEGKAQFDKALTATKSKNVPVLKAIAEAYLVENKYSMEAIGLLNKAKSVSDTDPEVSILLGDAYLTQNNGGLAVSNYEQASAVDPKSGKAHYKVGMVYVRAKTYDVALESLKKAVAVDKDYSVAYKELGEVYYLQNNGKDAVKAYEDYFNLTDKDKKEAAQLRYAFFLFMAKDYVKANTVFKELAIKPDVNPVTLRFYGHSLFEAGDFVEGKNIFDSYFSKAEPKDLDASDYLYYAKILLKLKMDTLAIKSLKKSLKLDSTQMDVMQLIAETTFNTKKYHDAIKAYKQLMSKRQKPSAPDYYYIGRAYWYDSLYNASDSAFSRLIELQPKMSTAYYWGGRAKSRLDPESENGLAKPFYEKVIEIGEATPEKSKNLLNEMKEAYKYLGYYYFIKADFARSKPNWEKVQAIDPADTQAIEALNSKEIKAVH